MKTRIYAAPAVKGLKHIIMILNTCKCSDKSAPNKYTQTTSEIVICTLSFHGTCAKFYFTLSRRDT